MTGYPTRQQFADQTGSTFTVRLGDDESLDLTLSEVNALGTRQSGDQVVETFSLIFEGPQDRYLPQGTVAFDHDAFGELVIFIVPLGPRDGAMRYEAIFN